MPAGRAGVEPGDRILKIDGLSTADMPLVDAIARLRGAPGSRVALSVARTGWGEARTITVARRGGGRASVRSEGLKGGVLYARIRELEPATAGELGAALERASTADLAGVVLDLRGTPRGTAKSAVAVADLFLPAGRAVARVESRVPGQAGELMTSGTAGYPTLPLVALVDAGTAGASELLAGALQDGGRAILVGVRTFGDGSSASIIPLRNGGALRLTTARYLTPKGHPIDRRGVAPDLVVAGRAAPTPDPRADAALERALEVIKVARIEGSRLATAA
jgi:carboxyl-terminal processing protease